MKWMEVVHNLPSDALEFRPDLTKPVFGTVVFFLHGLLHIKSVHAQVLHEYVCLWEGGREACLLGLGPARA